MSSTLARSLAVTIGSVFTFVVVASVSAGGVLWDNEIEENGINGRAMSPPQYPDRRVVDDFTVEDDGGWIVHGFRLAVVEIPNAFRWGDLLEVYVHADADGSPGPLIACRTGAFERLEECCCDPFPCVDYRVFFEDLPLGPGKYYIGARNPGGHGEGTNYWLTSNGGQGTEETGWTSADAGKTWEQGKEEYWHFAFELYGVAGTACPADLDGDGEVGIGDVLAVLSAWGPCPECPEDLDHDGEIGLGDLLILLAAWGPCP